MIAALVNSVSDSFFLFVIFFAIMAHRASLLISIVYAKTIISNSEPYLFRFQVFLIYILTTYGYCF